MQLPAAALHHHPTALRICRHHHFHNAHIDHSTAMTLTLHSARVMLIPLHSARFPQTGDDGPAPNISLQCRRRSLGFCRASEFEDIEGEEEPQMDSSVFEEVYPSVQRVQKPMGTRVRGLPVPQSTLIPDDWKDVQQYLHRSKKERKQETLARQLEWAKRRALEDRLTRQELENEQRRLREQELVSAGAAVGSGDGVLLSNEVEDPQMGVERAQNLGSGRARPRDFRSELEFTSVEEIGENLSREEEVDSTSESEDERVRKMGSEIALAQAQAPAASEKKHLLTPEEQGILKSKKLNFARVSSRKWSPLHTLAASGQVYLAAELLKRGVDLDAVDGDGLTPLHRAVHAGRKTMVRMLLKAGANAQVLDNEGATLLHYSALVGDLGISKLLLRHRVEVNVADADGWTPLHVAVQSGRLDVVKTLVYRGADIDIANKDGRTALDLGLAFGGTFSFYDAIKFLKKMSVSDSVSRSASIEDDDDEAS